MPHCKWKYRVVKMLSGIGGVVFVKRGILYVASPYGLTIRKSPCRRGWCLGCKASSVWPYGHIFVEINQQRRSGVGGRASRRWWSQSLKVAARSRSLAEGTTKEICQLCRSVSRRLASNLEWVHAGSNLYVLLIEIKKTFKNKRK